ncbi:hypothetical protein CKAH01_05177 [Colletotrichum kahawae]|uniref:Uncharacterized protein n=1 Tax=Colletotrichum kahawae TaxID=34407 RepID=A0AAD9YGH4_COLKA|nr:hypothetical protein CKAH01_05177 [Colletotrichum kahawae]
MPVQRRHMLSALQTCRVQSADASSPLASILSDWEPSSASGLGAVAPNRLGWLGTPGSEEKELFARRKLGAVAGQCQLLTSTTKLPEAILHSHSTDKPANQKMAITAQKRQLIGEEDPVSID